MELSDYLKAIRERWLLILMISVFGAVVAGGITERITPTYTGEAVLFLRVDSTAGSLYERSQFALQRVKSYPSVVQSPDVLLPVIAELDLGVSLTDLGSRVTATNPIETASLSVKAVDSTPERAAAIANAVSKSLAAKVASLETAPGETKSAVSLVVTVPASAPTSKTSPSLPLNGALGLFIGLALGLSAAIVLKRLDQRVRTAEDVRAVTGLPLVGQVIRRPGSRSHQHSLNRHDQVETTGYGAFLESVQRISGGQLPKMLVLVSASPEIVEPRLRLELASSLAQTGRVVCLLETEFTPASSDSEATGAALHGLADLLSEKCEVSDVLMNDSEGIFRILPSGFQRSAPSEFLAQQRFPTVAKILGDRFDVTLAHTTPVTRPVGPAMIAPWADCVVLVVEYSKSSKRDLSRLSAEAKACGMHPVGILMTSVPLRRRVPVGNDWRPADYLDRTLRLELSGPGNSLGLQRVDEYR